MKTYTYETTTPVSAPMLFRAVTDINCWPQWNADLEATRHDGRLTPGTPFMLKPKGGPKVAMEIEKAEAPSSFIDIAHLPLGKMRTAHEFTHTESGTRIKVTIQVWGPLGFLWDRVVARKEAAGAPDQYRRLIAYAEQRW